MVCLCVLLSRGASAQALKTPGARRKKRLRRPRAHVARACPHAARAFLSFFPQYPEQVAGGRGSLSLQESIKRQFAYVEIRRVARWTGLDAGAQASSVSFPNETPLSCELCSRAPPRGRPLPAAR